MSERGFLMTPGPTELTTRVLRAQLMPAIEPGDPAFIRVMDETAELLQKVFKTKKEIAFFPGSGRVTIESALASVLEPGDRISGDSEWRIWQVVEGNGSTAGSRCCGACF